MILTELTILASNDISIEKLYHLKLWIEALDTKQFIANINCLSEI